LVESQIVWIAMIIAVKLFFTAATASYRNAHLVVEIDFKVFNFKFIWFATVSYIE